MPHRQRRNRNRRGSRLGEPHFESADSVQRLLAHDFGDNAQGIQPTASLAVPGAITPPPIPVTSRSMPSTVPYGDPPSLDLERPQPFEPVRTEDDVPIESGCLPAGGNPEISDDVLSSVHWTDASSVMPNYMGAVAAESAIQHDSPSSAVVAASHWETEAAAFADGNGVPEPEVAVPPTNPPMASPRDREKEWKYIVCCFLEAFEDYVDYRSPGLSASQRRKIKRENKAKYRRNLGRASRNRRALRIALRRVRAIQKKHKRSMVELVFIGYLHYLFARKPGEGSAGPGSSWLSLQGSMNYLEKMLTAYRVTRSRLRISYSRYAGRFTMRDLERLFAALAFLAQGNAVVLEIVSEEGPGGVPLIFAPASPADVARMFDAVVAEGAIIRILSCGAGAWFIGAVSSMLADVFIWGAEKKVMEYAIGTNVPPEERFTYVEGHADSAPTWVCFVNGVQQTGRGDSLIPGRR
jgi:hypothetical protein